MIIFELDTWNEIWMSLKKNKLRTFLTGFGVMWGILMLVFMLGAGNGLKNGVVGNFGDFATNSFFIWTQTTTVPYKGFPRGRQFNFNSDDIQAIKEQVQEVGLLAPKLQGGRWGSDGENVVRGKHSGSYTINGDYPEAFLIDPVKIESGRILNEKDIIDKRKVAVIGTRVKEMMYDTSEDPIGTQLKIQGVYFTVIGVVSPKGKANVNGDKREQIWIPFSTLQHVYNYGNVVGFFAITAKDGVPASEVEQKVRALLKERHQVAPEDEMALGGFNIEEEFNKMTGLFMAINLIIWLVGLGTLLAGVIGISNIMLVVVRERTKEIGVRRAIGATPFSIVYQIILEAVVLTAFAGLIGLMIGVWLLEAVQPLFATAEDSFIRNPEVNVNVVLSAVVVIVVVGALAGFLPAKRAINIKAIDALRDE
ncbi:MAG: ABC transporter permease [Bacteroidales bacterium]|nr:ABC transporter permease [Bacteroidales bacterium]